MAKIPQHQSMPWHCLELLAQIKPVPINTSAVKQCRCSVPVMRLVPWTISACYCNCSHHDEENCLRPVVIFLRGGSCSAVHT